MTGAKPRQLLEAFFGLQGKGTSVQTEVIAGTTTFLTMSYIIFVNPDILSLTGMDREGLVVVTCLAAAIASISMGFWANIPVCQAPGMGLNAFFTFTLCFSMGLSWNQALGVVFISGVAFVVLTMLGIREIIVDAIPTVLKRSTAIGIGLFIAFIGFKNIGLIVKNPATYLAITHLWTPSLLLSLVGVLLMGVLLIKRVRGAVLLGILLVYLLGLGTRAILFELYYEDLEARPWVAVNPAPGSPWEGVGFRQDDVILAIEGTETKTLDSLRAGIQKLTKSQASGMAKLRMRNLGAERVLELPLTVLGGILKSNLLAPLPSVGGFAGLPRSLLSMPRNLELSFFRLSFEGLFSASILALIFSFMFIDLFDSVGTLIAVGYKARLVDEEGNLPELGRALQADAVGTVVGALLGTSTTTSYIESAVGVEEGGRTGLTAVICGCLFLLALFLGPLIAAVPSYAISPCLIVVGLAMLDQVGNINFADFEEGLPAFLTILLMPLAHNISIGLGFGFISYLLIKVTLRKFDEIHWMLYLICAMFVMNLAFGGV